MGSDGLASGATGGRNEVKDILITKPPNPLFPFSLAVCSPCSKSCCFCWKLPRLT